RSLAEVQTANHTFEATLEHESGWRTEAIVGRARERQHQRTFNVLDSEELERALAAKEPANALNLFGDGSHTNRETLGRLSTTAHTRSESSLDLFSLQLVSPRFERLGLTGQLRLGAEHRSQGLHTKIESGGSGIDVEYDRTRSVKTLYAQLDLQRPLQVPVDLALGGRYEDFARLGHAFMPHVRAGVSPWSNVMVQASWSESVRLPPLGFLTEDGNVSTIFTLPDPQSPSGEATVLLQTGKNAALRPEVAQSWNLGIRLGDELWQLEILHYDVRVRNRIEMPVLGSSLLTDPALAHLVDRSPTAQERKPSCTGTRFRGSKLDCLSERIDATLDLRMRNMSITQTRGFDIHARFARETDLGRFQFEAIGNYILDYAQAPTSAHDMR